jgi:hypothetical protein
MIVASVPSVGTATAAAAPAAAGPDAAGTAKLVTLIDGDQALVNGNSINFASPEHQYSIHHADGHQSVVPLDALRLIATGRVDERLFDITELAKAGYAGETPGTVRVAVTGTTPASLSGFAVEHASQSTVVELPTAKLREAWKTMTATGSGVSRIALARPVEKKAAAAPVGATHRLTVKWIDPAGQPTDAAHAYVDGVDVSGSASVTPTGGTAEVDLPAGRYSLGGAVWTGSGTDGVAHILMAPTVDLTADTTVVVDARLAKKSEITLPNAAVRSFGVTGRLFRRTINDDWIETGFAGGSLEQFRTGQIGSTPAAGEVVSYLMTQWALPGVDGQFRNSQVRYDLADRLPDQVLSGYQREVAAEDLAEVTSVHHAQMPGRAIDRGAALVVPESPWASGYFLPYQGGARVTEYVEGGGTQWESDLSEFATVAGNPAPVLLVGLSGSRQLQAGSKSAEDWDGAVIAPRLNERSVVRWGDTLYAELPMFSDAAGHGTLGTDAYDRGWTRMYRNGTLVGESAWPGKFDRDGVPADPGPATYRLETGYERSQWSRVSTGATMSWTFKSDTAPEGVEQPMPLWSVRFQPKVDLDNAVARRAVTTVPLAVESVPTSKVGTMKTVKVQVSGDGGKTWEAAAVAPAGEGRYTAIFPTPVGAKSLSLKANLTDSLGNSTEQNFTDAVRIADCPTATC